MNFSDLQLDQLRKKKIDSSQIIEQLEHFRKGFPYLSLLSPATIENKGIQRPGEAEIDALIKCYESSRQKYSVLKFVPASGAASRMFKSLFAVLEDRSKVSDEVKKLMNGIRNLAFYDDLNKVLMANGFEIDQCISEGKYEIIVEFLLNIKGLNYAHLPKGLLKFHKYESNSRTPVEEHLVESALYALNSNGIADIHFTLSPEHIKEFELLLKSVINQYEQDLKVKYNITYSVQADSTDTIAVDMSNMPFTEKDGSFLFRPGGHGALLHNLSQMDADIIFIKNIDNVVPDRLKNSTVIYKKAIGGYLIRLIETRNNLLHKISDGNAGAEVLQEAVKFLAVEFNIDDRIFNNENKRELLFDRLNRPMRVCGMVKNEGEPGGGPFMARCSNGEISLQIVESSQIDMKNSEQKSIFDASTHFNPVDLVCCTRDHLGRKYDLSQFVDKSTGFISMKSKDGVDIKALELPGLWNGAMAYWNTVFVEVPAITFTPVKTVNDLLRQTHISI